MGERLMNWNSATTSALSGAIRTPLTANYCRQALRDMVGVGADTAKLQHRPAANVCLSIYAAMLGEPEPLDVVLRRIE